MINREPKERIEELLTTALVRFALKENDNVAMEVIEGLCSWGIGVCPEFSWYAWEDDEDVWADWLRDYAPGVYLGYDLAMDIIKNKAYAMHLVPTWEYDGNDQSCGVQMDYDPSKHTFGELVDVFYRDYLDYCDHIDQIMLDKKK